MSPILPSRHQRALPLEKLILEEAPGPEAIEMDVLFVGAGPAGLAGAIELARLAKADQEAGGTLGELNIGVLEKAAGLGEHEWKVMLANFLAHAFVAAIAYVFYLFRLRKPG